MTAPGGPDTVPKGRATLTSPAVALRGSFKLSGTTGRVGGTGASLGLSTACPTGYTARVANGLPRSFRLTGVRGHSHPLPARPFQGREPRVLQPAGTEPPRGLGHLPGGLPGPSCRPSQGAGTEVSGRGSDGPGCFPHVCATSPHLTPSPPCILGKKTPFFWAWRPLE